MTVGARGDFEENYPLARLTTIGTGGPARWFARPTSMHLLTAALRFAESEELPVAVVGLGSNLLVADAGFDGLALRLDGSLATIELDGEHAICGGGASLAAVVRRATDAGLSGIEFGCAIPGTVGGAVRMNAGAYGGELRDVLIEALVVSAEGVRRHGPTELEMTYRHSNIGPGEVVAVAMLQLAPAPRDQVRATVKAMQARRTAAQPRKARTFGSVFKNPDEGPGAGQLLESCGLKGHVIGGAQISTVHANFIENLGDASSADVAALIGEGRRRVREQFGVELQHEVELLGAIAIP
jgi:UDP-N-acetylenolpyruvoylglucosamine reductase